MGRPFYGGVIFVGTFFEGKSFRDTFLDDHIFWGHLLNDTIISPTTIPLREAFIRERNKRPFGHPGMWECGSRNKVCVM